MIFSSVYTFKVILIIITVWTNILNEGTMALRQPLYDENSHEEGQYGSVEYTEAILKRFSPHEMHTQASHTHSALLSSERKHRLAKTMKERFQQYRKSLDIIDKQSHPTTDFSFHLSPISKTAFPRPEYTPLLYPDVNFPQNALPMTMVKHLRSAEEALSSIRSAGLRPEAQPFQRISHPLVTIGSNTSAQLNTQATSETAEAVGHTVLEDRLGPSVSPTFDPSIVVDFFKLLQLTRQSQRSSATPLAIERNPKVRLDHRGHPHIFINSKSPADIKVIRRKLKETTPDDQILFNNEPDNIKLTNNRVTLLQFPSSIDLNSTRKNEAMSVFVFTEPSNQKDAKEKEKSHSEFGPYSEGNDPAAGIPPSEVKVPDIDLPELKLPESVRDSLRKYLSPLISALKPLRKSVPGLPGLDYPILSVVPYTNFYCNNMPWPGFYADTEARCQTWHACDIDGRQSTFLCPNGTVFNQALMVCDWWYNTDCLTAPLLYPLNERLFGPLKQDPVTPHSRITPELLDTIFV